MSLDRDKINQLSSRRKLTGFDKPLQEVNAAGQCTRPRRYRLALAPEVVRFAALEETA